METLREIVVRCERSPQMAQHRYAVDVANDALKKAARAASIEKAAAETAVSGAETLREPSRVSTIVSVRRRGSRWRVTGSDRGSQPASLPAADG